VLAIAAGATLCGMRGYKAISDWAQSLGPKARQRFRCRRVNGRYLVPSESIIRDVLVRVEPTDLDRAFKRWNASYGKTTPHWPSTAKRYAMPSTLRAINSTS